ncbi:hypothetical protein SAMN06295905_0549 [Devosia lucknowensis]|uniref:Uncharacterized protein n=1 Tax=Devosia lucknowensis TaxID=1096929 RepID=A0A1Y6EGA7_9HYPH|nr:hypothetical protein [Devosia lucknowensis]SMQ61635.1 hypothetical protein SAMN06295905_0549 [Devosia lucknowensis]
MKLLVTLALAASTTGAALAQDIEAGSERVLVDADFGLTLETPEGFDAQLLGQMPEGHVLIKVSADDPDLPPLDGADHLCDLTFNYDPNFGQGDQQWVNSLADGTGFYERMAEETAVPGTVESGEHFTHRGSSSHIFFGRHDLGGAFAVAAIPTTQGYALLTCATSAAEVDWDAISPLIDAITVPGQPRDHLAGTGTCEAELDVAEDDLDTFLGGSADRTLVAALDAERGRIADACGGDEADAVMDAALEQLGATETYRAMRYDALARIGSDLLTPEQHEALDDGRQQVVAASDEPTGERYLDYMHFTVGLRGGV